MTGEMLPPTRAADRIEAAGAGFLERVAGGFASLAKQRGWLRIDATAPADQVTAACRKALLGLAQGGSQGAP